MKEVFVSMARYNRNVNNVISAYIAEMDKKKLTKKFNTHYPSLLDNLIHVMQSDAKWLQRMSEFFPETHGKEPLRRGMPQIRFRCRRDSR